MSMTLVRNPVLLRGDGNSILSIAEIYLPIQDEERLCPNTLSDDMPAFTPPTRYCDIAVTYEL